MRKVGLYLIEERLYDLIRSIFEKVDYVKLSQLEEAGEETERPILIFTSCNYRCDLSLCSKKFYFLFQNKEIPFFILRPIYIKNDIEVPPGFFLGFF